MYLIFIKNRALSIVITLVLIYSNLSISKRVNKVPPEKRNTVTGEKPHWNVSDMDSCTSSHNYSYVDAGKVNYTRLMSTTKKKPTGTTGTTTTEYPHLITETKIKKTMKAVVLEKFGAPANLKVKEIPVPEPNDDEILIEVKAAGLNYVDIQMRSGQFSKLPTLPAILGKEAAGIVVKLGKNVSASQVALGERVVCCFYKTGAYAEYVTCNPETIIRFTSNITFLQASTLYVSYVTAYRALVQKAHIKEGEKVYIHGGTGGFGIAALQIAKSRGCTVISSYGSPEGKELLLSLGADYVNDHKVQGHMILGFEEAGFTGYDVVIDTVAHLSLAMSVFSLKKDGRVCIIGSKGNVRINPISLMQEEGEIHGVMLSKAALVDFYEASIAVTKGIYDGWIHPVVERVYKIEEIAQAHRSMEYKLKTLGKYVLVF